MFKRNRRELIQYGMVGILFIISWGLHTVNVDGTPLVKVFAITRYFIQLAVFALWTLSLYSRVVQKEARYYLTIIGILMVAWLLVRAIKHNLPPDTSFINILWYLYYIPIIFIPLLLVFLAYSVCRHEDYRIPKTLKYLYIPAALLVLLVLTNDLHNLVFILPKYDALDPAMGSYKYNMGYYIIYGWSVICYILTVVLLLKKNRILHKNQRILIPIGCLALLGGYLFLYNIYPPFIHRYFNDVTVGYCICFMMFLESLLFLGFIQSNNHYLELFNCSGIPAMIVDENYHQVANTATYASIEGIEKLKEKKNDFINAQGIRLSYAPITHGYVLWEEDVSLLIDVNNQLASIQLDLQEQHSSELEAYKAEQLHQRLTQRNRLFDLLLSESHEKVEELEKLVNQLEHASKQEEEAILLRLSIMGAYIKRRYNLSFLALDHKRISSKELQLCIQQSLACLKLFKITTYLDFNLTKELAMHELIQLFEIYEEVIEMALEGIEELYVSVKETDESILMNIRICTKSPLNALKEVEVVQEDENDWLISYRLKKGDTNHG